MYILKLIRMSIYNWHWSNILEVADKLVERSREGVYEIHVVCTSNLEKDFYFALV